jgi:hypothetical protein
MEGNIWDDSKSFLKALPIARLRGQKLRPRRGTLGEAFKGDFSRGAIKMRVRYHLDPY